MERDVKGQTEVRNREKSVRVKGRSGRGVLEVRERSERGV